MAKSHFRIDNDILCLTSFTSMVRVCSHQHDGPYLKQIENGRFGSGNI
jgi:hypothetical protein